MPTAAAEAVSTAELSAVALSMAVAFVPAVSVVAVSTVAAFVATVLVITDSLMSSSAATVIRVGGIGAIHTDITVTTITRTITMDTAGTHTTTMDTADTVTDTAMAADQGISGVCGVGDKPGYGSLKSPAC